MEIEIRLLPSHPLDGKQLREAVSVDTARRVTLPLGKQAAHQLVITAVDEGVVLDQVLLHYSPMHSR